MQSYPVFGIYQPRAIKYFTHNGVAYVAMANEGDSKDYDYFTEERRVSELTLSSNFGNHGFCVCLCFFFLLGFQAYCKKIYADINH